MATLSNITVEQLAQAFKSLTIKEKIKLFDLLSEGWFNISDYSLTSTQKKMLDNATKKENEGRAIFHSWEEVESFVRDRNV